MSLALDWYERGPQCMNCGQRVLDAEVKFSEHGVMFSGICKSEICRKLPPGGNPFMIAFSNSGREEE